MRNPGAFLRPAGLILSGVLLSLYAFGTASPGLSFMVLQAGMIGLLALLPRARAAGVIRHLPAVSSPVERRLDRYIAPPHLRRFHRNGPVRSTPVRSRRERTISDR